MSKLISHLRFFFLKIFNVFADLILKLQIAVPHLKIKIYMYIHGKTAGTFCFRKEGYRNKTHSKALEFFETLQI